MPDGQANELDFLGVGVVQQDPVDIEYQYFVHPRKKSVPTVDWREAP